MSIFVRLLLTVIFGVSSFTSTTFATEKKKLMFLEGEILLYKGVQYINFIFKPDNFGAIVGEIEVGEIPLRKWATMNMGYLRSKWDRNIEIEVKCDSYYCESLKMQAIDKLTKNVKLACQLYVSRDELWWLQQGYECDREVDMHLSNDNKEISGVDFNELVIQEFLHDHSS